MKLPRLLISLAAVLAVITGSNAEEKKWSGEAELSFVDTEGNTDVMTLSAKNLLKYRFTDKLEGAWKLAVLYGESDGEIDAENYLTELRLDYEFTKRSYSMVTAGWSKDQFAGIDSRYYVGPGVGYKFLIGPKHLLNGEAGLNYVSEEYTNNTDKDYLGGRVYAKYEYVLTERNKFSQLLEFLYDFDDSDNYDINSETALIAGVSDYFSLKTSYSIRFHNQPVPSTLKKTDTVLAVTLLVSFH